MQINFIKRLVLGLDAGVIMKNLKRCVAIIAMFLVAIITFSLTSCSNPVESVEIKIQDMFTNEEKTFSIFTNQPKQIEIHDGTYNLDISTKVSLDMKPKVSFDEIYNQLSGYGEYRSTRYSGEVGLLQSVRDRSIYCLVKTTDNSYTLSNPYIKTFGYKIDYVTNTSEKVSQYICFPIYFFEDVTNIGFKYEFELDKEYKITCTKDEMKKFYVNLDKFNVEDTEDGFLVNGFREVPKVNNRFDKMGNYRFTFSQKDNSTVLVLSMI